MKKTLLLFATFLTALSAFKTEKTNAQATAITITDSVGIYTICSVPQTAQINPYGTLTGTLTATNDSIVIYANTGDGFDTTFTLTPYSGPYYGGYFNHTYNLPGTYVNYATATSLSVSSVTATDIRPGITLSNSCATLQGHLYVDLPGTCIKEPGDPALANVYVLAVNTATHDTIVSWADDSGYYAIELPPATYNIIADYGFDWFGGYWFGGIGASVTASCPSSGAYSFTATSVGSYSENFAFTCTTPTSADMQATAYSWDLVPGDTTQMELFAGDAMWYYFFTCTSLSATVTLTLNPHLHYAGYNPLWGIAPASVSGSVVTWNMTTVDDYFSFWQQLYVYVDPSLTIGDTLCNTLYVTPTSLPDPDLSNNTTTFCSYVVSSWDPNGMVVSPQGVGTQGYIPNETELGYEIHFQNTGTAPAQNITINDTLSPYLDVKTLHVINSTAPVQIYTSGNNVQFSFNEINLPDSMANPTGSIGSISYEILPVQSLAPGTQIFNKASIYFDYNAPVVTNSVLNTINNTLGVQHLTSTNMTATVYPNPAGDAVFAKTDDLSDFTMTMMDMLGRTIGTSKSIYGIASLETQSLPTGLYLISLTNISGKQLTTKVTIEH